MRIALVSATERTPEGELRAEQLLAGRSVLEWQIDLALALGCERIICLCQSQSSDFVIGEQRRVEGQGLSFHAVRNHLQMVSLIRADDQIFVQLGGLIVEQLGIIAALKSQENLDNVILALRSDHALSSTNPDDFQRIDMDRHWGGIAVLPGECALALKEMPEDGDAVSLLLRLGLQARVPCNNVPAAMLDNDRWILAGNREAMEQRGRALIAASLPLTTWIGPGVALAGSVVRLSANRWLSQGGEISAGIAIAGMLAATGLAAFGLGVAGLGVAAISAFAASLAKSAGSLRQGLAARSSLPGIILWLNIIIAVMATGVLIFASLGTTNWQVDIVLPVIAMGLAHITGQQAPVPWQEFWRDAPTHLVIFAICAAFGILQTALLVFLLGAVLQLMLRAERN